MKQSNIKTSQSVASSLTSVSNRKVTIIKRYSPLDLSGINSTSAFDSALSGTELNTAMFENRTRFGYGLPCEIDNRVAVTRYRFGI